MSTTTARTVLVVGASRGLGRGIATTFAEQGERVVAVARDKDELHRFVDSHPRSAFDAVDATSSTAAHELMRTRDPDVLVLVAGATPTMAPLHEHTWDSFSANWHTDVQLTFHFLQAVLTQPMRGGGRVIVLSSGAALAGSPLSGGYAGAKATQRLMAGYAQAEADRRDLGITVTAVLPRIADATELGRAAAKAYAQRGNQTVEQYLAQFGPRLTPAIAGREIASLSRQDATTLAAAYLLSSTGLVSLAP